MRAIMNKNERDIRYMENTSTLIGTKTRLLTDNETGELMKVTQTTKLRYGSKHFWKCYIKKFLEVMKSLSARQFTVFIYIIEHTHPSTNLFIGTYDNIVKDTGCCRQTVAVAMKKLQTCDFIRKKQNGIWMINPEVLMKGNDSKQYLLLSEFRTASYKTKE